MEKPRLIKVWKNTRMKYMRLKGFTLVELLVVMAILSVLVSLIAGGFRSSQARGRDAQRKSDLKQIANSLELYYSDYNKYPDTIPWGAEFTDGRTIYFKVVPRDPTTPASDYLYRVPDMPTNQEFQLYAYLENTEDKDIDTDVVGLGLNCGKPCNFGISSTNTTPSQ